MHTHLHPHPHARTRSIIAALLALLFLPFAATAFAEWDDSRPGQFALQRDGKDVWRFHFDTQGGDTKPYFDPVSVAGGPSLTWARPKDHVWHLGLWFAWKYINGVNYWEENAGKSSGETRWSTPEITRNADGSATLALALEYIPRSRKAPANAPTPASASVLTEARTIAFSAPAADGSYFMDWTQVFTARTDVKLDRTPPPFPKKGTQWGGYAGLSIRYAEALSDVATVASTVGHVPRDSHKRLDVFSDSAVEQNGLIAGAPYGIAILAHPANPRAPGDWYPIQEKNFNYLNASLLLTAPFFVAKGETFTLRYRVHVHPGRWDAARLRAAADAYIGAPAPKTAEPFNVLVYSRTNDFRHDEAIDAAIPFLKRAGAIHNFNVDATEDATRFTPETLKKYRAIILLYTSGEFLADKLPSNATPEAREAAKAQLLARRAAFENYVSGGGALVGIHTTTEFGAKWEEFGKIIGGYFTDHPKHQTAEIVQADAAHPAVSHLPARWKRFDEWYNFKKLQSDSHVLLTVDEKTYKGGHTRDNHPITWTRTYGKGKVFYTAIGHYGKSFDEPDFTKIILGGLFWTLSPSSQVPAAAAADRQPENKQNTVTFENTFMRQSIEFKNNTVTPVSIFCKKSGKELLSANNPAPWFEFVVNEKLVTSASPLWEYGGHTFVALANGGTELRLRILGSDSLKGLVVEIQKQFFPDSTLTRERLLLSSNGDKTFRLNKSKKKLHFRFPHYSFSSSLDATAALSVREQRIATWDNEPFPEFNKNATWDQRAPRNLATLHAFSPVVTDNKLSVGGKTQIKGPFQIIQTGNYSLLTAYEHASQDSRRCFKLKQKQEREKETLKINGKLVNDEQLGASGESDLDFDDESLRFLEVETQRHAAGFDVGVNIVRGGYFDNELIPNNPAYETVWSVFSFYENEAKTKDIIHRYLTQQITTHKLSRVPRFYYNTWGMQRAARDLRKSFSEQRIIEEAAYAAQTGVEVFVMDDGWQELMGVWTTKKELKNGLKPIVDAIKKEGMVPGIWLCPMGLDTAAKLAKEHPEWLIKDKDGKAIKASWDSYFMDFVGDYYGHFVNDCKKLIDEGILFFKWDGMDSYPCSLAGQHHGSENETPQERKNRYDYLLPFYVTRAMRELREYNPNVVIEVDVTEAERCLIGLMPLQEGKLFWMNNGASGYGDYSSFRTKSMRTVANRYDGVLPSDIFTYAVYPQNAWPTYSQRHNVNTALVAGHGIWGNLKEMREGQRKAVGEALGKARRVLPRLSAVPTQMYGRVGASPEIYSRINSETAWGMVVGFSGSLVDAPFEHKINAGRLLCVLGHAYSVENGALKIPFQFTMPDDSREAFILGNEGSGVSVLSSTGWLADADLKENSLVLRAGADTRLALRVFVPGAEFQVSDKSGKPVGVSEKIGADFILRCELKQDETLRVTWKTARNL